MIHKSDIKDGEYYFELYAQNDIHGRFFNSVDFESGSDVSEANISAFLKNRREEIGRERVIAVDCGDNLQGDLAAYYSCKVVRGEKVHSGEKHLFSRIAEYIGLDAVVVGNHDLEAGHEVYERIKVELEGAGIPYLAANAICAGGEESYFTPYTILERGGVKVAVIGLTNPLISKWLPRELWSGIEFTGLLESARKCIEKLRREDNPHLIVLAVHSGVGSAGDNHQSAVQSEHGAMALARQIEGVDVILASHDHKEFCTKVPSGDSGEVLLMAASSHANSLQCAKITLKVVGGSVISKSVEGEIVPMKNTPPDRAFIEFFKEDIGLVQRYSEEVIGRLGREISTREALFGPSHYLNFMHALQLEVTGAQVSFISPYIYNMDLPAGEITRNHLFALHSCENYLYKVRMSGEQIKGYLEYSYGKWVSNAPGCNVFPLQSMEFNGEIYYWHPHKMFNFDSAGGINYTVDVTADVGERVKITTMQSGEPFNLKKIYTVALSSYRVSGGGDLFDMGAGVNPAEELSGMTIATYPLIRELMEWYFKNHEDESRLLERFPGNNWSFIPEKIAAQGIENAVRLLFK